MADMLSLNDCCSQNLNHVVCLRVINIDDLHDDVGWRQTPPCRFPAAAKTSQLGFTIDF